MKKLIWTAGIRITNIIQLFLEKKWAHTKCHVDVRNVVL